jgi:hypothetical protein
MSERLTSFSEILAPLERTKEAYPCRRKRFLAVSYTNCPEI